MITREIFVDPRQAEWSLLVQVDTTVVVGEIDREAPHRVAGEILLDVGAAWGSDAEVRLRRLGLSSAGGSNTTTTGEISISASRGHGSLRLISATAMTVQLDLHVEAMVTYWQIAGRDEGSLETWPRPAPAELFMGSLSARLTLDPERAVGRSLVIDGGEVFLNRVGEELGSVRSLRFDLGRLPAFSLLATARPVLSVPLRPIRFPLDSGGFSGETWTDQLERANEIWSACSITFEGRDFIDGDLAQDAPLGAIINAHREDGVIEIFLVQGNYTGFTDMEGTASARVLLPEPADPNLLAHELSHVLGGCDPEEGKCGCLRWEGIPATITDPVRPISDVITEPICSQAREFAQPLLETLLG